MARMNAGYPATKMYRMAEFGKRHSLRCYANRNPRSDSQPYSDWLTGFNVRYLIKNGLVGGFDQSLKQSVRGHARREFLWPSGANGAYYGVPKYEPGRFIVARGALSPTWLQRVERGQRYEFNVPNQGITTSERLSHIFYTLKKLKDKRRIRRGLFA